MTITLKKTSALFTKTVLALLLLNSCEDKKNTSVNAGNDTSTASNLTIDQNDNSEPVIKNTLPIFDKKFDNTARILSGLSQEEGSPLASLDTASSWRSFATSFDSSWALIEEKRFKKMREWSTEELANTQDGTDLFYPFSGPDVLNAFILFPKAKNYTLLALEPIGDLPDFSNMTERQKQEYYLSIELSLNDLLNKSYFITKNMLRDLQKHKVNGTLPLMCLFLKRTGNTITNIQKIGIDTSGAIIERTDSIPFKGTKGVKIDFFARGENQIRSVYYFKCDLANSGIKANKGLANYLVKMDSVNTYLKSASYLLHYSDFSTIRNTIFDKSKNIVQDDSGIAYHYFDKNNWQIQLYGKYAKPVADFPHIKEPDLKEAYEKDSSVKVLSFELGYHWGTRANNMLKATKKTN